MRSTKVFALALVALGLAPAASAQRSPFRVDAPTIVAGHAARRASISSRLGRLGVHIDRAVSRHRSSYVTPRCPTPTRVWIQGHYSTVQKKVWVPERRERVWCEPVYATRYDSCGKAYTVLVRAGYYRWVTRPGCYELRPERVWVAGHWEYRS